MKKINRKKIYKVRRGKRGEAILQELDHVYGIPEYHEAIPPEPKWRDVNFDDLTHILLQLEQSSGEIVQFI